MVRPAPGYWRRWHPMREPDRMTATLIVLTSHATLGDTGRSTGFYVSEAAHPWEVFTKAGHTVSVASVLGGDPPRDGDPAGHDDFLAFLGHDTPAVGDLDPTAFDAVFLAGGHGTMWDFADSTALQSLLRQVYEQGGVVGAVCHGPAGLVGVTLTGGGHLVAGRDVAAFTDEEERAVGLTDVVPFALQRRLEALGARHTGTAPFQPWVVRDGRLVTGQNPASATGVAEAMLDALAERAAVTSATACSPTSTRTG
jgi:putative intracellular protease/amidase